MASNNFIPVPPGFGIEENNENNNEEQNNRYARSSSMPPSNTPQNPRARSSRLHISRPIHIPNRTRPSDTLDDLLDRINRRRSQYAVGRSYDSYDPDNLPAAEIVMKKLKRFTWKMPEDLETPPMCSICHDFINEGDKVTKFPCVHCIENIYHTGSDDCLGIDMWLENYNHTCPKCRYALPYKSHAQETNTTTGNNTPSLAPLRSLRVESPETQVFPPTINISIDLDGIASPRHSHQSPPPLPPLPLSQEPMSRPPGNIARPNSTHSNPSQIALTLHTPMVQAVRELIEEIDRNDDLEPSSLLQRAMNTPLPIDSPPPLPTPLPSHISTSQAVNTVSDNRINNLVENEISAIQRIVGEDLQSFINRNPSGTNIEDENDIGLQLAIQISLDQKNNSDDEN